MIHKQSSKCYTVSVRGVVCDLGREEVCELGVFCWRRAGKCVKEGCGKLLTRYSVVGRDKVNEAAMTVVLRVARSSPEGLRRLGEFLEWYHGLFPVSRL